MTDEVDGKSGRAVRLLRAARFGVLSLGLAVWVRAAKADAAESGPATDAGIGRTADPGAVRDLSPVVRRTEPTRGFAYGLRSGLSLPFGYSSGTQRLADEYDWRVPVWLDLGYRINSAWYVAFFAQAGLARAGEACRSVVQVDDAQCNVEDYRLGVEAELDLLKAGAFDLWLGLALGWEVVTETSTFVMPAQGGSDSVFDEVVVEVEEDRHGPTLGTQVGVDFAVDGPFEAGPFLGYTAGAYVARDVECSSAMDCPAGGIGETSLHHWIVLGGRGTFGP